MPLSFVAGNGLNLPNSTQTPNQVAPIEILHGIDVGNPWFSTKSFANPAGQVWGNMGRKVLSGPGLFAINAALSRSMVATERGVRLDLRAEAFNLSNTPQ